ncbi:MAG: hypothetical protein N3D11_15265 [Candidatus Sumerlaeia bacterium]|nr:hypothetical protein [Candidatus Sumerlaeia bacterium]
MKRLFLFLMLMAAVMACSRSGKPLVVETGAAIVREYFDPHYWRDAPLLFKVIWFIGPGHCPVYHSFATVVGIDLLEVKDPDTGEIHEYRSPVYYLWLHPIKKELGWYDVPSAPAGPTKPSAQPARPTTAKGAGVPAPPPLPPVMPMPPPRSK